MNIQYLVEGVATVPVPDDFSVNDIIVTTTVQYPGKDGKLLTVDAWENQVTSVQKEACGDSRD